MWICGGGRILRYDGTEFTRIDAASSALRDLTVAPNGDGLAVGENGTVVERVDGTWRELSVEIGQNLQAITRRAADVAVGASGTVAERRRTADASDRRLTTLASEVRAVADTARRARDAPADPFVGRGSRLLQ